MSVICDFGTAPEQAAAGFIGLGILVYGSDVEVLRVFKGGDIRLVRGAHVFGTDDQFEFYPMVKARN